MPNVQAALDTEDDSDPDYDELIEECGWLADELTHVLQVACAYTGLPVEFFMPPDDDRLT